MGILARVFVVCLMASCHGIASCAVVQVANKQELGSGSPTEAKPALATTVSTLPENTTSGLLRTVSTVTKIRQGPSVQIPVIQNTSLVTTPSPESSSLRPTRTGEDTSSPAKYSTASSRVHSPIMTTIPQDNLAPLYLEWPGDVDPEDLIPLYQDLADNYNDELVPRDNYDDGYGFGYGSSTSGPVNGGYGNPSGPTNPPSGGYGSPPEPTGLPTGGYGNPPPPAIVNPTFVTIPDPPTVTVSLEIWSSSFDPSTSTNGATVVVVEPAPSTELPVPNVTVTIAPPEATFPLPLPTVGPSLTTTIVPAETAHSTPGYVYTTVTPSYMGPHAVTSTFVIVHTPTAHPTPVPLGTSAGHRTQPNIRLSWAVTILAVATVVASYAINGPKLTKAGHEKQSKYCEH